jgi:hypothetical protein
MATTTQPVPEDGNQAALAVPPPDEDDEGLWAVLLDYIEEGTVVPVVGRDLLVVETADATGQPTRALLYSLIAKELARALKVAVDPTAFEGHNPLGVVASEFIVQGGVPNTIYRELPGVVARINQRRVPGMPEALRKLAAIDRFTVFVTTTFDPLLGECVAAVRRAMPAVLTYAPRRSDELAGFKIGATRDRTLEMLNALPAPVIVHILGRLSSTPNYVVTEEDAFEFVYSLQETRPEGFFDLLAQMKLLIVGCRFPSWLVRFFLRTSRRKRLLQSALDRTDFVVDPWAADDASLVQFLRNFKTQTEIFTRYTPTGFVDELYRRWRERAGPGAGAAADVFRPGSVFVSYASEDAAAAARIAGQIAATQLPVWLDRLEMGAGDEWARKIRRSIDMAAAFVPILSRSCAAAEGEREFRKEWRHAYQVKSGLPQTEPFIYPLVIDDLSRGSDVIDQELRAIHWDAPEQDGSLSAAFTDKLRKAYRGAQLRTMRG